MKKWRDIVFKKRCCECGWRDVPLIQWMATPKQWVCIDCAWKFEYPDWLAETFKAALP